MQGFYDQFNEKLARSLHGQQEKTSQMSQDKQPDKAFSEKSKETAAVPGNIIFEDGANREGQGRLMIQVFSARGALPVEGARVTVSETEEQGGAVIANLVTDRSGKTERIEIAAPLAKFSQQPGNIQPYHNVNIMVESPGYRTKENVNVPIFDKIESIQPVALEPLPEGTLNVPQEIVEYESVES